MTEEQKAIFCDEYCKHKDNANSYISAARNCSTGSALKELIDFSQRKLYEQCEKCILNEA